MIKKLTTDDLWDIIEKIGDVSPAWTGVPVVAWKHNGPGEMYSEAGYHHADRVCDVGSYMTCVHPFLRYNRHGSLSINTFVIPAKHLDEVVGFLRTWATRVEVGT